MASLGYTPPDMPPNPRRPSIPDSAIDLAERHLRDVLSLAIEHSSDAAAIVVWDGESELSIAMTEAYRRCLPDAKFIEFDCGEAGAVLAAFEELSPRDLVVLIQSTSFRLDEFRIRVELFKRAIKVIEHPHLARLPGPEGLIYIDSLAYDRDYYRGVGLALKTRIDRTKVAIIDSGGEKLIYPRGLEPAKLNVGDYREMVNIGGQYPIGEVFTESMDLEAVHGRVRISFFGDRSFSVNKPDRPITLVVAKGRITEALDSTPEFERVLSAIRSEEGEVRLRELGFGMNRAFSQERFVSDVGSFERMCGVHLSLGAKHRTFNKSNIRKKTARHHVDVFVATESVILDDEVIYGDGAWQVNGSDPVRSNGDAVTDGSA